MLRKIASRWWIILLSIVVCIAAAANSNYRQKQLYTGRTTLLASVAETTDASKRVSMNTLAQIARSSRMMGYAALSLSDCGGNDLARRVLPWTSVEPVKDTNILAVEVTLPDPAEAKLAADVVAASIKKACQEILAPKQKDEPVLKTIDPAIVFPVDQRRSRKLLGALLAGLIAGIVIAAMLPGGSRREERSIAGPTDGSDN